MAIAGAGGGGREGGELRNAISEADSRDAFLGLEWPLEAWVAETKDPLITD